MQQGDVVKITILEDGTIKTQTGDVGQANHQNATQFLNEMARLCGGESKQAPVPHTHAHSHAHDHAAH